MRLLIVEDNRALAHSISRAFAAKGHAVDCVHDGEEADAALAAGDLEYDLVILDLCLPELDGLEVLRRLRGRHSRIPVLVLTARDAVADRVHGLDLGADDYLGKPFALQELVARAGALMRRGSGEPALVRFGQVELDTAARIVRIAGEVVDLRRREINLLEVLIARRGQVVPKQVIHDKLFGMDDESSVAAVETYVHRVRKKLSHAGVKIRTLRGLGYLLEDP